MSDGFTIVCGRDADLGLVDVTVTGFPDTDAEAMIVSASESAMPAPKDTVKHQPEPRRA